ncbi:ribonuclease HII [Williamsoniiplasma somnilux]|uniref:Ribonuclease HII n=1 Tax=Williamsoniiplasma somnilux TaxID=215578 RepID=A0A2K8P1N7_9MOLU|nr:ribonuclease HII [Williamsoniiplasma somnilux]ATZ18823.1 ribonuclease HII [Williamsoniiplasma somnilux]
MIKRDLFEFDNLIRTNKDITYISGSDEAGRGAMAGPIVVASVILPKSYQNSLIRDSKKLPKKLRESLFNEIIEVALTYDIKIYDSEIVDKLNPKATSILGMQESIQSLKITPEICLVDGEKIEIDGFECIKIIKGDDLSQNIAAASILAKVTRDQIMVNYAKKFPHYNFEKHKGYCTLEHQSLVIQFGVLPIHRLTYAPIKKIIKK